MSEPHRLERKPANRPEQERKGQARHHEPEADAFLASRSAYPRAHEKIERQKVDPTGKGSLLEGEQPYDGSECAEPSAASSRRGQDQQEDWTCPMTVEGRWFITPPLA